MSSDLLSVLGLIQLNNYASVVLVTAVVYDYLLTFPREIDYVWCRPWTWVSTVFVLVRYLGLSLTILAGLNGSTFVPGPVEVSTVMLLVNIWELAIFRNAADLVMILRVFAIWSRSKRILWILLLLYVPQVILSFFYAAIYDAPDTTYGPSVTIVQIANFSFCAISTSEIMSKLDIYGKIPQFVLGAALFVLAATQTLKQSIAMYRATKRWQPNQYMGQFLRDGILYFLINMFSTITSLIQDGPTINSTTLLFLTMLSYITICPIMPRFIISVRELYDRDLRGRGQGIDTGFGVSSQTVTNQNTRAVSAIAFADVAPGQGHIMEEDADESEAIRLEAFGDHTRQV